MARGAEPWRDGTVTDLTQALTLDVVAPRDVTALREWFELERDATAVDHPDDPPPCWTAHRARLTAPWPGEDARVWLARIEGRVVGVGVLGLPQLDNTDNATGEILVAPAHRRRGVGRRILSLLADEARRAGRVRLILEARAPLAGSGAGPAFLAAAGAREVLHDVRRRVALPGDDDARARLGEQVGTAAEGYDIVQWTNGTPPQWLDDIARLTGRMSTDAPLGGLHWAPERHDAQRVQARDAMTAARGISMTVTAARAPDGTLAAFTEIAVYGTVGWHAHNWDTLVAPEHRGRRLGLRVKLANLALARARHPELRAVDTYNAASNSHMIAINEAMGFRARDLLGEWELDL